MITCGAVRGVAALRLLWSSRWRTRAVARQRRQRGTFYGMCAGILVASVSAMLACDAGSVQLDAGSDDSATVCMNREACQALGGACVRATDQSCPHGMTDLRPGRSCGCGDLFLACCTGAEDSGSIDALRTDVTAEDVVSDDAAAVEGGSGG